jgi:hypothetical protein
VFGGIKSLEVYGFGCLGLKRKLAIFNSPKKDNH